MVNIIFFCNWGWDHSKLLDSYKHMTKDNSGKWNNINPVTNINNADIIIFIEGIPKNFNLKLLQNKRVICFPREPLNKKNWEYLPIKNNFTYNDIYHVVTNPQFINKNYDFLTKLEFNQHNKLFSAIISNKSNGNGYKLRRNLLINLSKKYPKICDIYGSGWNNELSESYKGQLGCYHSKNLNNSTTKYDGLINYKYSLCIENCSIKNYFTEKFTDTLLCWTIPIYYGCANISEYFPDDSYYFVDITKSDCIEKIIEIINKPITQKNIDAMKIARELILNKYNIWSTIENLI